MEYEGYQKIRFVRKDGSSPEGWHLEVKDPTGRVLAEYEPCNDDIWLRASQIRFGQNLELENSAVESLPMNRDSFHEKADSFTAKPDHYLLMQMVMADRHTSMTMIGKTKPIEHLTLRITVGDSYGARVWGMLAYSYEDANIMEQWSDDAVQIDVELHDRDFESLVKSFLAKELHSFSIRLSGVRGLYTDNKWLQTQNLRLLTTDHEIVGLPNENMEIPVVGQLGRLGMMPHFVQDLDPTVHD